MKRVTTVVAVLSLTALLLAGCTGTDEPDGSPQELESLLNNVVEPTWAVDAAPIGSSFVVTVDDTVLAYVKTPEHAVTLAAYNSADGTERWTRAASINNRVNGSLFPMILGEKSQPIIAVVGEPVAQSNDTWAPALALIDPKSGAVKASASEMWVSSIWDCGLKDGVCFWGNTPGVSDDARYQLTLNGGVQPYTSAVAGYSRSRDLGAGVWGVADEAGEEFVLRIVDGKEAWKIPAIEVVGGDGKVVDSLGGWYAREEQGALVYNSTGVTMPDTFKATAAEETAGFIELATGKVRWTKAGFVSCGGDVDSPILCNGEWSLARDTAGGAIGLSTGDVTMTGVDSVTGETRWQTDFKNLSGLGNASQAGTVRPFATYWPLRNDDELVVLDWNSGALTPLSGSAAVACTVPAQATFSEFSIPTRKTLTEVTGATIEACTASGSTSDPASFTRAVVEGAGSTVLMDGEWKTGAEAPLNVVQTETAILGYVR
ncbi:hypothetical protein [Microbacterium sp. SORGH_AS_0888]|uniref:hypothetical protein n=1 Tax=Microbacterium sp. SORGH_AS_0888 TaxID=3041791 RepID=UPI00278078F6|nr:hypothetical protein [Microbacterium sp. SORGH_AS_0888]MDQ1130915.1 hypothetical protein [Microbacterium sp. SORGH_AS_0888]